MELLFILVSFCLGITFSQLIDPPEIAIPIPRIGQYSNKNKEATLECRVESKRLAIVTWKRHGRPILHGRSKYQLSKNVRRYGGQVIVDTALRIRNIRDPDFGEYVCSAWIYGIRKEASIVLYELNAPQPTSSPAPTYHSAVITTPSDEETSTEGHDVPLITIPYPRIGQYSNRNKEAIMECRVRSKNNAIVTWKRHGRTILNRDSKYLVSNGLLQRNDGQQFVDSVLRILNISDSDFGEYVCFARINGIQVGASVILYGEYKIRLTNLEQPPPHLLIREIKRQWVSKLSKQLLNTALVSTILPVMEKQNETEEDKKYFVLGGNHLVQATRAIWPEREMTCHVYRQLTTEEALRISSKHNSKQKAIPLTFQDKVKLARRLIQTSANGFSSSDFKGILGEIEMKEIKDSISTVLSVARYSQRNFNMFSQIADDWETKFGLEKSINQKLFKQLQAETEDTRNITLKMAVTESVAKACTWLDIEKQKEAAKRVFIKETGSVSWQNAQDTYPAHAEKLMKFAELFTKQPNSSPAPTDHSSIITTPSDDGTSTESHGITGTALEQLVGTTVAMATREIRKELEEVKAALMTLKRVRDADREKMKKHFQKFVDSLSSYM